MKIRLVAALAISAALAAPNTFADERGFALGQVNTLVKIWQTLGGQDGSGGDSASPAEPNGGQDGSGGSGD